MRGFINYLNNTILCYFNFKALTFLFLDTYFVFYIKKEVIKYQLYQVPPNPLEKYLLKIQNRFEYKKW